MPPSSRSWGEGRSGEKEGKVVVQTYNPEHPAIRAATIADYLGFAREELAERRKFAYPPFFSAIRFVVRGPDERETAEFAKTLGAELRAACRAVNEELGFVPPERAAGGENVGPGSRAFCESARRIPLSLANDRLARRTFARSGAPRRRLEAESAARRALDRRRRPARNALTAGKRTLDAEGG